VATEFSRLGPLPILKARMNADLHMADDLKNTDKGNLFVVFGEPDIELLDADKADGNAMLQVKIRGVDVSHPTTGEVRSDNADGIACWFIDTDYDEQSFFVRHAYFLGAGDPYAALKTTLKAEIDPEAWESLRSDTSRPFARPAGGRIAVKAINHLGDEVMKVFRVSDVEVGVSDTDSAVRPTGKLGQSVDQTRISMCRSVSPTLTVRCGRLENSANRLIKRGFPVSETRDHM